MFLVPFGVRLALKNKKQKKQKKNENCSSKQLIRTRSKINKNMSQPFRAFIALLKRVKKKHNNKKTKHQEILGLTVYTQGKWIKGGLNNYSSDH